MTKLEYFFDTDPGFGNGKRVDIAPTTDLSNYTFAADITSLNDSVHTLYIRVFDDWGITNTKTFIKGSALPLTWLSFNATAGANNVLLNWKTVNEINNNYFEAERSVDGRNFTKIGTVNAGTAATQDYQFTDNNPAAGISYYRIKQVDKDGRTSYSAVIAIRFGKNDPAITVYPNPATSVVNVLFDKPQQKDCIIELISNNGQLVQRVAAGGLQSKQLNVSGIAAGTYQLRIIAVNNIVTQKLIIQH